MSALKAHQSAKAISTAWLTPPAILAELGPFDYDPCAAPEPRPWPTAGEMVSLPADGLARPWRGRVWLNPPYSTTLIRLWLSRMAEHDHGTALIPAMTETLAWHSYVWPAATALLFIGPGRLFFYGPNGEPADDNSGAPSVLCAYGFEDADRLAACGIGGKFVPLKLPRLFIGAALASGGSWVAEVVAFALERPGPVAMDDLYRAFAHHPKARGRRHWRAKIRQTVQRGPFRRAGRGVWALDLKESA